jgi:streptogramin lyase
VSVPLAITAGPDGNLWFVEDGSYKIGRITPGGTITEFPVSTGGSLGLATGDFLHGPGGITAGPDGNLWFTGLTLNAIGRITPRGTITVFPLPASTRFPYSGPADITTGPDGNLWFTETYSDKIGRITPGGTITVFPLPAPNSDPWGITTGPDGNLWFVESGSNKIGRISTSGTITEFPLPASHSAFDAKLGAGITTGPDGNLWFTEASGGPNGSNQIGRLT